MADTGREPWQLERFIALFNEVAAAHKEWPFEETPDRIKTAQQRHECGACWRNLPTCGSSSNAAARTRDGRLRVEEGDDARWTVDTEGWSLGIPVA